MAVTRTDLGAIHISSDVIAMIVGKSAEQCYGIVGMAPANLGDGIAEILQVGNLHRGVKVQVVDERIVIDLYVVIQYGTRISEVAQNVMEAVKFNVERSLGMPVAEVNIHVQGLHLNRED